MTLEESFAATLRAASLYAISERDMNVEDLAELTGCITTPLRAALNRKKWPLSFGLMVAEALGLDVHFEVDVDLPCPQCGKRMVMGYYLLNDKGEHNHTHYVCLYYGDTRCGWHGWTVPDVSAYLRQRLQFLVNWINDQGLLEDGGFTFPDGETWWAHGT